MFSNKKNNFVQIKFGPRWKYIACIRTFIQEFLVISVDDKVKADNIAMAVSELLENAVKFAKNETTNISVAVDPDSKNILIEVSNEASDEAIAELKKFVTSRINNKEPLEAYISLMKEVATKKDNTSQLGLARIRYETGGDLILKIKKNNVIISIKIE